MVAKPDGMSTFGRKSHGWENNVNMGHKEIG
jgi:hypothetical protein